MRFNKLWFNDLYFIINKVAEDHKIRKVLIYGGKASAKTISICQFLSKECLVKQKSSIAFRKESTIIPTTIKHSFELANKTMWLTEGFTKLDRKFVANKHGAEIVLKGMDDAEKAKGVEGYQFLYFDELNQFDQKEWEQACLSLRGSAGQKAFASWNPVNDLSWVKTEFIDKHIFKDTDAYGVLPCANSFIQLSTCGTIILIKTTYEDNYWIAGRPDKFHGERNQYGYRDESTIAEYKGLEKTNPNSFRVNVLGEWGKSVFGGEFLKDWHSDVHVGDIPYNPDLALYLMFDENVVPYFPCAFYQTEELGGIKHLNLVHIISAKNPNNKVKKVGPMICSKLREWNHVGPIFIGGDATSQKEDVKQEKGHDLFKLIMGELLEFKDVRRFVNSSNPSVTMSGQFANAVLGNEFQSIRVRVDRSCRTAILDYENTLEDKNGKIDKSTIRDPETDQTYQPFGHYVDLKRYTLVSIFPNEYKKFQTGGHITTESFGKMKRKSAW